ncbi:Sphingomyelin phosphodiesterase [Entomophthora muscae]|uniref:Sphingomyelin phosphodiesterase n=1 Tax=Entomophthora muscae TaxID=34485 RepID=A0ACC2T5I3_9FUNG|nr:Sphingomyelin phosphodiesterase [Entomophthora muscae]
MRWLRIALVGLVVGQVDFEDEFDVLAAIPVVRSQQDLDKVNAHIVQAESDLSPENNRTSRIVIVAGVVAIFASIYSQGEGDFSCKACQTGIAAAARVSRLPGTQGMVLFALKKLCEKVGGKSSAVCEGVAGSTGKVLYDVLNEIDLRNEHVRQVACYAVAFTCPMPEIPPRPQWFPSSRIKAFPKPKGIKFKYILQLSDLHYDHDYLVGAEADCTRPVCCQRDSNADAPHPKTIKRPAGKWGDFRCDLNKNMFESLLAAANRVGSMTPFDMVLFTGDIPPHDMWKESIGRGNKIATAAFETLHNALGKYPVYPVVGNHEPVPINQFPLSGKMGSDSFYLYSFLANQWRRWLPESALTTIRRGGYYAHTHNDKLRIITLNNNLCYIYNFHLLLDPSNPDPDAILEWLTQELQQAEDMKNARHHSRPRPPWLQGMLPALVRPPLRHHPALPPDNLRTVLWPRTL